MNKPLTVVRSAEAPLSFEGGDPHRGVRTFPDYTSDLTISCDVLVVGSGPGGAVVAKELAEAGRDVVLIEEGPPFGKKDFDLEAGHAMQKLLREGGTRATRGNMFIPTMQANALGGGSLINSAICARAPEWIYDKWNQASGVELDAETMAPHFERAAARLEPAVRLAKLDTDANPATAGRFAIRSIPTLILFRNGREIGRRAGAMDAQALADWARSAL